MLFERTALSRKPENWQATSWTLCVPMVNGCRTWSSATPYILDFLNLTDSYSERDLETAILCDIEAFLLEMGSGFSFVARQKRVVIGGEHHTLDLLFYYCRLGRLVAVDPFWNRPHNAEHNAGQMELYMRWLEENEQESSEDSPLGLILCTEGGQESIALLQLDQAGIRVGQYLTELSPKKVLERKLHESIELSRALLEVCRAEKQNSGKSAPKARTRNSL